MRRAHPTPQHVQRALDAADAAAAAGIALTDGTVRIAPTAGADWRWHVTAGQRTAVAEHLRAGRAVTWLGVHQVRISGSDAVAAEWGLFHVEHLGALALEVTGRQVAVNGAAHLAAMRAASACGLPLGDSGALMRCRHHDVLRRRRQRLGGVQ